MEKLFDFFIPEAMAQTGGASGGDMLQALFFPILLLVVFYFLLIRPQQKRAKEHKQMVESLKKGDEIVTTGGLLAKILEVGENFILVDAGESMQLKVQRQAVSAVMPKGTIKSL